MRLAIVFGTCLLALLFSSCEDGGGLTPGSGNGFESAGDAMGIDDIVTDASFPVTAAPISAGSFFPMHLMLGATPEYYHGRYIYNNGGNLDGGRFSFKIVKNSNSSAYFADWKIHNTIVISDPTTGVTNGTEIDLAVPTGYDGTDNAIFISNEFKRYVKAKINFGAGPIGDIANGIFMFSEDYTTMVGGDNTVYFIATRGNSPPSPVGTSDLTGSWGAYQFANNNGTSITTKGLSSDVLSATSVSEASISAINGDKTSFSGVSKIMSADIGIFIYAEDAFGVNLSSVDGVFLIGPNKDYSMRFDLNTDLDIWANDKF